MKHSFARVRGDAKGDARCWVDGKEDYGIRVKTACIVDDGERKGFYRI